MTTTRKPRPSRSKAAIAARKAAKEQQTPQPTTADFTGEALLAALAHPAPEPETELTEAEALLEAERQNAAENEALEAAFQAQADETEAELLATWKPEEITDEMREEMGRLLAEPTIDEQAFENDEERFGPQDADLAEAETTPEAEDEEPLTDEQCAALDEKARWLAKAEEPIAGIEPPKYGKRQAAKEARDARKLTTAERYAAAEAKRQERKEAKPKTARTPRERKPIELHPCACGCGTPVRWAYKQGHGSRTIKDPNRVWGVDHAKYEAKRLAAAEAEDAALQQQAS